MGPLIEAMRGKHADEVALLVEAYWRFEGIDSFSKAEITALLNRLCSDATRGFGLVARSGDRIVGYLLIVYVFSLEHRGLTAEVDEFFVHADHRGAGVGLKLLQEAERVCAAAGCTSISLQLGRGNSGARRFYTENGYVARVGFDLLEKPIVADR